jgi:hypothetical protein
MNTRIIGLGLLGFLTAGCGGLIGFVSGVVEPSCVVQYIPVTPQSDVGLDGCGNAWVRQDGECWILADSIMVKMPKCPAEGDTLGDGK